MKKNNQKRDSSVRTKASDPTHPYQGKAQCGGSDITDDAWHQPFSITITII